MATTSIIGDIRVKVGEYHDERANQKRNRSRTIGTLFVTRHSDGKERHWMKLNLEHLQPSLFALTRRYVDPGEDTVACSVFPREDNRRPASPDAAPDSPPPPAMDDDDIPF